MEIREFGTGNSRAIVLIHPSLVTWDYFEYVIPLLESDYRLVVPDCKAAPAAVSVAGKPAKFSVEAGTLIIPLKIKDINAGTTVVIE